MFLAELLVPTTCDENDKVAGVSDAAGAVPIPFRVKSCAEPRFPESSITFKAPVTGPTVAGVNVTDTMHVEPAGRTPAQLSVSANPSLADRLSTSNVLPPKLAIVMVWGALVVPVFSEKVSAGGEKLIAEGRGVGTGAGVAPKT
jgi:hypothetical protein